MKIKKLLINFSDLLAKHHIVLLSFSIPVLILIIAYAFRLLYPFGDRVFLLIDLYHQYAPFLTELRDKLLSFSNIQYTWNGGLGTSFLPLFAYYLASPLNILTVLFPRENITEAILFLVLLKTGLSGAFFAVYLKNVYRENRVSIIAFSLMYSLSGYLLGYSWNIMWLDCIYMLPLVILGLVKICRGEKGFLYCISLAIMLYSNFYIAFFGCLFIALYYPVCLFEHNSLTKPKILIKRTGVFTGYSILGAGLSAFLLIPTWYALKLTSASGDRFPSSFTQYHDIFDYFITHLTFMEPTVREGMPNAFSGIIVLILIPLYFMSRRISHKAKAMNAILLLLLVTSFNVNVFNFIWHGLHFPNQLPFRNSFVYIFLMVSLAYPAYRSLKEFSGKNIGYVSGLLIILIILFQKLSDPDMNVLIFYGSIFFIIIYTGVLTLHKRPGFSSTAVAIAFVFVVIFEMSAHTFVAIDHIDSIESYAGRTGYAAGTQVDEIRKAILDIEKTDKSFYRTEILPPRTTNDPFLYGFKGLSVFSSTMREKNVKSLENFGYHSNGINSYKYEGSTIVADSLFGIKYLLKRNESIEDRLRESMSKTSNLSVYFNPYALSLGFYAPLEAAQWKSASLNPFNVQSSMIRNATGVEDIFRSVKISKGESENFSFESFGSSYMRYSRTNTSSESTAKILVDPDTAGQIYFYLSITPNRAENGYVMIDDKRIDFNARRATLVDLGYCSPDSVIEINISFNRESSQTGNFEIRTYSLVEENFINAIDILKANSMIVDKYNSTGVKAFINAPDDGIVITTVPYDVGWRVYVDGKKTDTYAFDNAFVSFEVDRGYHNIEMKFTTDKLPYSMIVSLFSLLVLAFFIIRSEQKKRADL